MGRQEGLECARRKTCLVIDPATYSSVVFDSDLGWGVRSRETLYSLYDDIFLCAFDLSY